MMSIDRRTLLRLGGALGFGYATRRVLGQATRDPYQALIGGQYVGNIELMPEANAGLYLGDGQGESLFPLTPVETKWNLRLGEYAGMYHGTRVDIHGYWIFSSGRKMCWQAQNYGNGALRHWNWDHKATGNPEDWELFTVEPVSAANQTVRILNAAYGQWLHASNGSIDSDPHVYISLVGNSFWCNANKAGAAVLRVRFVS